MDERTLLRILGDLKRLRQETARLRIGEVTDDSPLTITLAGSSKVFTSVTCLSSYAPVVSDRVVVLARGNDLIVLGAPGVGVGGVGGPPSGPAGGVLGGSYPNPSFASDMATQAELDAAIAGVASLPIAESDVTNLVTDLAAKQPLDSDLTAIAALTTTSTGRSLLAAADAAALRVIIDAQHDDGFVAKTNANNNFSTTQAVTGTVTATTGLETNGLVVADADGTTSKIYLGSGAVVWGSGLGDTSLARTGAAQLTVGDSLIVNGTIDMTSGKITSLADGTASGDAIHFGQYDAVLDAYKSIRTQDGLRLTDAVTAATFSQSATGTIANVGTSTGNGFRVFYLDPAEHSITGRTTKLNLRCTALANATGCAVTLTGGLHPVSATAGAADVNSITVGAATSGSTAAFASPAASTRHTNTSGDFDFPTAGYYILAVVSSGTFTADASVVFSWDLRIRHV